jgi:RNA polymerase sigma factor (sigma-70 family)
MDKLELYKLHYDMLLRYAITLLKDPCDAYDILQKVYIYLNNKDVSSFTDEDHARRWMLWLVKSECRTFYRRNKKYVQVEQEQLDKAISNDLTPDEVACKNDIKDSFYSELPKALDSLTDIHKKYIVWNYIEGKSAEDISKDLNVKLNTVQVGIHRAIKNLKKYFKNTELLQPV